MIKGLIKKFVPSFLLSWYHFLLSFLGAVLYGFPSRKIKVIGVTGTNGKTTTVYLITKVLEAAGYKVASLSSIQFKINDKTWPNTSRMTMPGRFIIKKFLRQAVKAGCQYAVLEVASEGIKQHRHRFIDFEAAVFTNLTPEHIEAHKGFENYKKAKGKLFQATKNIHVINLDDENAEYFLQFTAKKKYGYTMVGDPISSYGDRISIVSGRDLRLKLKLPGEFNVYNALAAISVGLSQEINLDVCRRAAEQAEGIPGRMEEVIKEPFKVIVDYAFTPNALEKVYQSLRQRTSDVQWTSDVQHRLVCVLGAAGGGRDKWKRPVLGQIAAKYCQEIIITNEDPYDENPLKIIEQVAEGTGNKARKILDRREAIKEALKLAKNGDTIVITGKGCERSICLAGGKKIPWDEKQVVKEEFDKLSKTS